MVSNSKVIHNYKFTVHYFDICVYFMEKQFLSWMICTIISDICRKKCKFGKKYLMMHIIRVKMEIPIIIYNINTVRKIKQLSLKSEVGRCLEPLTLQSFPEYISLSNELSQVLNVNSQQGASCVIQNGCIYLKYWAYESFVKTCTIIKLQ